MIYFYCKTKEMHQILEQFYFEVALYVFDGLSVHHQESETVRTALGVCQTGLLASLFDIYPMLYVQSRTPDDGRKDRPKHVD